MRLLLFFPFTILRDKKKLFILSFRGSGATERILRGADSLQGILAARLHRASE